MKWPRKTQCFDSRHDTSALTVFKGTSETRKATDENDKLIENREAEAFFKIYIYSLMLINL